VVVVGVATAICVLQAAQIFPEVDERVLDVQRSELLDLTLRLEPLSQVDAGSLTGTTEFFFNGGNEAEAESSYECAERAYLVLTRAFNRNGASSSEPWAQGAEVVTSIPEWIGSSDSYRCDRTHSDGSGALKTRLECRRQDQFARMSKGEASQHIGFRVSQGRAEDFSVWSRRICHTVAAREDDGTVRSAGARPHRDIARAKGVPGLAKRFVPRRVEGSPF
jgi:hypothetical protein